MCPRVGDADRDGSQEGRYVANVVNRQSFEVGETGELSKFLGGSAGVLGRETIFETAEPKDPHRGACSERRSRVDQVSSSLGHIDSNADILQLSPVPVRTKGGENLIQHRSTCVKVDFLYALYVG